MPRIARVNAAGIVQHILNRGNRRASIFGKSADYNAFVALLADVQERVPMRLLGYCLMPNHWHLVLWPEDEAAISAYMHRLTSTHVRRYHQHHGTWGHGHVYQGRFKSFLVDTDDSLLRVLRYVEGNALRCGLVSRAEDWPWSSLTTTHASDGRALLSAWPVRRPNDWAELVNASVPASDLKDLRTSAMRGRPYGRTAWVEGMVRRYGLEFTMRPVGRGPDPQRKLSRQNNLR